ncbi:MAG: twin-arginine translocase subunit TatC [Halobacteriales archaeon]
MAETGGVRETLGVTLKTAQIHLRKVFVVFLLGLVGTIYFMRVAGWEILRGVTTARMSEATALEFDVIVRTPFDVILLQVKLGLIVGAIVALPVLVYYLREELIKRGQWPFSLSLTKAVLIASLSFLLFAGGISYAYFVFFPVAFNFLTNYTLQIGFQPTFDIVKWTQFILLLTISFGLAAQLPLVMSGLSYADVIPYEYFRATALIFVFGALFSPPDPFTQIMWAVPLIVLYGISLYLTKFTTAIKRGGSAMVGAKLRRNWYRVAAPFLAAGGSALLFLRAGGLAWAETTLLPWVPADYRPADLSTAPLPGTGTAETAVAAAAVGAVVAFPFLIYYAWPELQPRGSTGDPHEIDPSELSVEGVEAAPAAAFANMSESGAVEHAREAMDEGDGEKAQAILDRYDEATADAEAGADSGGVGGAAGSTLANMGSAFTEEETDEEELGGYAYDAAFVLESLTSKSFRVVGVFMAAVMLTFFALYGGAFKAIRDDFFARLPPEVVGDVDVVALHPVEALLFEVKMSLIVGVVAALPAVLYYAWPAIEERFYGLTFDYATPPPGAIVREQWNKVAAFFVLGAAAGYVALTGYVGALPDSTVNVAGYALAPATVGYLLSALVGLAVAVPVAGYYASPSLRERWTTSKRGTFLLWAVTLAAGVFAGSAVGYAYIAPAAISYLIYDAIQASMVIKYTINEFFWLIFVTTVGIGLLADIPMTMWLFHRAGIISYRTMRDRWRGVVFVAFVAAAAFTDRSVVSMFLFGIPITMMYWSGLAGIWVGSLSRRTLRRFGVGA